MSQLTDCFDATLGLVGPDETEREAPYDGHVPGVVTAAVTRQIVLELDVEQPVHALDAPVMPRLCSWDGAPAREKRPGLNEEELVDILSSNRCRCTGDVNIIKAVRAGAADMKARL